MDEFSTWASSDIHAFPLLSSLNLSKIISYDIPLKGSCFNHTNLYVSILSLASILKYLSKTNSMNLLLTMFLKSNKNTFILLNKKYKILFNDISHSARQSNKIFPRQETFERGSGAGKKNVYYKTVF